MSLLVVSLLLLASRRPFARRFLVPCRRLRFVGFLRRGLSRRRRGFGGVTGGCRRRGRTLRSRLRLFARLFAVGQDLGDAQQGKVLAMSDLAAGVFTAALFEGDDLRSARLLKHFSRHRGSRNGWRAERQIIATHDQDLAELHYLAGLAFDFTDLDHILGGYPVLLAAGFKDREHISSSSKTGYQASFRSPMLGSVPGPDSCSLFC